MTCGNRATQRTRRLSRGAFRAAQAGALLAAPLLVLLCMLVARAQPREVMTADNPLYLKWSKFKPGTMIKYRIDSDRDGTQQALETTETLLEFLPGKAVVEIKTAMESHGARIDISAVKQDIPERVPQPPPPATEKSLHSPSSIPAATEPVTSPTAPPATGSASSASHATSEPTVAAATLPATMPSPTATEPSAAAHPAAPASLPMAYTTGPTTLPKLLPITFAPPAFFDAADPVSMLEEAMSITFPGLKSATQSTTRSSTQASTTTASATLPASEPAESEIDGEESLVINGRTFICHVAEKVVRTGNIVSRTKTWTTNEVPGGLIRMESTMGGPVKTQTVLRLIDFVINR